ncbi:MAG: TPMT family class I SAM-dependent methyltransferase, partial [Bacteroidia bacterium]|nr:TPMT family class I SAM-dependent methyltransferase [Bacteroidia bacterium]
METQLNQDYWNQRYLNQETGWDMGMPSPPLIAYLEQITNKDTKILIPGCGNAYEAEWLVNHHFTNVTVLDIAPEVVKRVTNKLKNSKVRVVLEDFFEHTETYDLILEQTFFCAIE